eukprot:5808969-Amphidinium_carterae.2
MACSMLKGTMARSSFVIQVSRSNTLTEAVVAAELSTALLKPDHSASKQTPLHRHALQVHCSTTNWEGGPKGGTSRPPPFAVSFARTAASSRLGFRSLSSQLLLHN